jgi:hypothetical protein
LNLEAQGSYNTVCGSLAPDIETGALGVADHGVEPTRRTIFLDPEVKVLAEGVNAKLIEACATFSSE